LTYNISGLAAFKHYHNLLSHVILSCVNCCVGMA